MQSPNRIPALPVGQTAPGQPHLRRHEDNLAAVGNLHGHPELEQGLVNALDIPAAAAPGSQVLQVLLPPLRLELYQPPGTVTLCCPLGKPDALRQICPARAHGIDLAAGLAGALGHPLGFPERLDHAKRPVHLEGQARPPSAAHPSSLRS